MLVEDVVPAIKAKWPDRNRDIVLQQDGALAHIPADNIEFGLVARNGTWNINILTQQAPSSLDTSICDLSFSFVHLSQSSGKVESRTILTV
jgi:hypothetical protein